MKIFTLIILFLATSLLGVAEEKKLSHYIDGLLNSHDLAAGLHKENDQPLFIPTYLSRLKLSNSANPVPVELYYDLWRHYLDCHHLCQVFYHQTYILPEDTPIVSILDSAFPGFSKASKAEGGMWINRGFEFLKTVDPHEQDRTQAERDAEQDTAGQSATVE